MQIRKRKMEEILHDVKTTRGGVYCLSFDAESSPVYLEHAGEWIWDCLQQCVIRHDGQGNKRYLSREIAGLEPDDEEEVVRVSGTKFDYRQSALRSSDDPRQLPVVNPPTKTVLEEATERGEMWSDIKTVQDPPACCVRFSDSYLKSVGWGKLDPSMCESVEKQDDDSDNSSEDSYDEVEIHNTSDGPVLLKKKYEWSGAPGLSEIFKKTTGCEMMKQVDKFVRGSANRQPVRDAS